MALASAIPLLAEPPSDVRPRTGPGEAPDSTGLQAAFAALDLAIVDTVAGLEALAEDWQALWERSGEAHQVFQSHGFARLWARVYDGRPAILTGRIAGQLVLVWPLVRRRSHGLTVLSWLGEPVCQYGDLLIDHGLPRPEVLRAAWRYLLAEVRPDIVRLRKVRADAAIQPLLAEIGTTRSDPTAAPLVRLAAGGSPFESRQSGKAMKNRRRLLRRLEEHGRVELVECAGTPDAAAVVAAGVACKRAWLVRHGLLSPALADRRFETFMTEAASTAAGATGCAVHALVLDGRPVGVALGFLAKRRLMLHLITHEPEVERFGVGVLNLEAILRRCEAAGLEGVDLLPPLAGYKLDWTEETVPVADHVIGLSPAGRMWARLLDGKIKPWAKEFVESLPLDWRRRLSRRSLRGS